MATTMMTSADTLYQGPSMLIGGRLVEGALSLDVIDPARGEVFARCGRANREQLDEAVYAAAYASTAWAARPVAERGRFLTSLADAIEARRSEFAALLTAEQGKPIAQAEAEIDGALRLFRYYAGEGLPLRTIRESDSEVIFEQRIALGIVAAITPWNYPVSLLAGKIAPALLAGNTVIAKPAPSTPLTTLLLGKLACPLLPPGVLNIVIDDNDLGEAITTHPAIAKVSFTGSTATGRRVMSSGAPTLKRLTLELGGNDPAVLLDDVDLEKVAGVLFRGAMINAGQVCMAAKRIYVPRAAYDRFCELMVALAEAAIVGPGADPHSEIGPLQNEAQYRRVLSLIDEAKTEGSIIAGGHPVGSHGYFIAPTIISNVSSSARIVREEQFGPVLPVIAYENEGQLIDWVNDSEFGLGASVWTADYERGLQIAQKIVSGTVWVNKYVDLPPDVSFGGLKQSGVGRERGREGLLEYTQLKIINIAKS